MVKMYGPSFDGSGTLVNREVPEPDVPAYLAAGYVVGEIEEEKKEEPKPKKKVKK